MSTEMYFVNAMEINVFLCNVTGHDSVYLSVHHTLMTPESVVGPSLFCFAVGQKIKERGCPLLSLLGDKDKTLAEGLRV